MFKVAKLISIGKKDVNRINDVCGYACSTTSAASKHTMYKRWSHIKKQGDVVNFLTGRHMSECGYIKHAQLLVKSISEDVSEHSDDFNRCIVNGLCLLDIIKYTPNLYDKVTCVGDEMFIIDDEEAGKKLEYIMLILKPILNQYFADNIGVFSKAKAVTLGNGYDVINILNHNGFLIENYLIIPDDRGDINIQFNRINPIDI